MKRGRGEMAGGGGGGGGGGDDGSGGSSSSSSTSSHSSSTGSSSTARGAARAHKKWSAPDQPSWLKPVEEGAKRTRRPPPRFETAQSSREESIIRQAIENSKIETTLSVNGVADIPEVPTYRPTVAEFREPLQYIESIRAEGERYGIVKIIPPAGWAPPAAALDLSLGTPFKTKLQSLKYFQEGSGFGDGKEYTFASYQAMADAFRAKWVAERYTAQGKPAPSLADLERDYWRIVEAQGEEVDVEYGNDLDTLTYGSGFPRPPGLVRGEGEAAEFDVEAVGGGGLGRDLAAEGEGYYARCGWNLNNLPLWPGSVLRSIRLPLKGVNVPWLYMGMLFATFCWHNEDNFLYSLNYLHRGAAKQWYTVPGDKAEAMEGVMRSFLRETFQRAPDLLHHMTTHFSPMLFQRAGVPVFKTVQEPGQFIVTFPKSLHAGFSYGFNCAEAVNMSPPAWLPFGREAVERYRKFARNPVFSHDRLVLTLASNLSPDWSEASVRALLAELTGMARAEAALRKALRARGVRFDVVGKGHLPAMELRWVDGPALDYDEMRVCLHCRHVCCLSAVACECDAARVACLRDAHFLCGCPMERRYLLPWQDEAELWALVEQVRAFLKQRHGHGGPGAAHEESKEKTREEAARATTPGGTSEVAGAGNGKLEKMDEAALGKTTVKTES